MIGKAHGKAAIRQATVLGLVISCVLAERAGHPYFRYPSVVSLDSSERLRWTFAFVECKVVALRAGVGNHQVDWRGVISCPGLFRALCTLALRRALGLWRQHCPCACQGETWFFSAASRQRLVILPFGSPCRGGVGGTSSVLPPRHIATPVSAVTRATGGDCH